MKTTDKLNFAEYKKWLEKEHGVKLSPAKARYETIAKNMRDQFVASEFWRRFEAEFRNIGATFQTTTGYELFTTDKPGPVVMKSFDACLLKTYRQNVIDNDDWPHEPSRKWILPVNWFERANDIVRTLVVVKYLDGLNFVAQTLHEMASIFDLDPRESFQARDEGYYAAHVYLRPEIEIPGETWDMVRIKACVEIQIATQIQDVIRKLLHTYYEENRTRPRQEKDQWRWDYKSDRFVANSLGHVLHYMEAMILDVREKQKQKKAQLQ